MNFKTFSEKPPEGNGGKPIGTFSLARQPSIYSLTFDEFQNTLGDVGKDFGSMNMEELLKNIWTAEGTLNITPPTGGDGGIPGGNLQRQGSLTLPALPRTLSQKTVDEVWKDLLKENAALTEGGSVGVPPVLQSRNRPFGEMTLEEFLVRVGVVKEDAQPVISSNNGGFYEPNHSGLVLGFQHPARNDGPLATRITESNYLVPNQPPSLALTVTGARSSQQQQQQQPPLFPKQATVAFASPVHLTNTTQLASPTVRVGIANPTVSNGLVQNGMIDLEAGTVSGAAGHPASHVSSNVTGKCGGNNVPSLSPAPYVFNGGQRGRKPGALEKVVERRQRRMIKNRESAARSRARKQVNTHHTSYIISCSL